MKAPGDDGGQQPGLRDQQEGRAAPSSDRRRQIGPGGPSPPQQPRDRPPAPCHRPVSRHADEIPRSGEEAAPAPAYVVRTAIAECAAPTGLGRQERRGMMSLKGKVAIVTGGNSGIGKAVTLALAGAGANVVDRLRRRRAGHRGAREAGRRPGRPGHRGGRRRQQGRRPADAHRPDGQGAGPARHHGQQRRHRDPHLGARHHRSAVREGPGRST